MKVCSCSPHRFFFSLGICTANRTKTVGQAEKEGESKQRIAKINAHTAVLETERKVEKANADQILRTREIAIARELNLEQIAAQRAADQKDAELQKIVEQRRAEMELEKLRATKVTAAKIARESAQEKADADLYASNKKAEGDWYMESKNADALQYKAKADADAALYKRVQEAEALLATKEKEALAREREAQATFVVKQKEAAGVAEMAKAYSSLAHVLGGPQGLMQYLMLQDGTYEKLARANAQAVHGLQPKINVWTTGNQGDGMDAAAPIRNLFQSLPPLFSTIQDQTGISPPQWLAQMPNGTTTAADKALAKQRALKSEQ